jgi:hypothetical protein
MRTLIKPSAVLAAVLASATLHAPSAQGEPCTPLKVVPKEFINEDCSVQKCSLWLSGQSQTAGERRVSRTPTELTVSGPTGKLPGPVDPNDAFMFLGSDNNLLLLHQVNSANFIDYYVGVVNFTTTPPSYELILGPTGSRTTTPPPRVQFSQGAGNVFLIYS